MRMPERRVPPLRLLALMVAAVSLLAVAALASRAHVLGESPPPLSTSTSRVVLDALFYMAVVLELGVLALIVWVLWPDDSGRPDVQRRSLWHTLVTPLLGLALVGLVLLFRDRIRQAARGLPGGGGLGQATPASLNVPQQAGVNSHAGFDWLAFAIVALIVAAAVAYGLYRRHQGRRRSLRERRRLAAELDQVMNEGLEELALDDDPRRAVIAAYARMERVLAAQGRPRRRSEAPIEYVRRLLREAELPAEPLFALTHLYERAHFSTHQIDPGMRAEAIDLLERIRRDLRDIAQRSEAAVSPVPVRA
jgi:hypothetical protein